MSEARPDLLDEITKRAEARKHRPVGKAWLIEPLAEDVQALLESLAEARADLAAFRAERDQLHRRLETLGALRQATFERAEAAEAQLRTLTAEQTHERIAALAGHAPSFYGTLDDALTAAERVARTTREVMWSWQKRAEDAELRLAKLTTALQQWASQGSHAQLLQFIQDEHLDQS